MTDAQFESLVDAMMDDAPSDLRPLRDACVEEVIKMAPLIDNMLLQSFNAGKLDGMLTILTAQKERRKEVAASTPF